mgnify:FL=1
MSGNGSAGKALLAVLLILASVSLPLRANPFTGSGTSPSVRTAPADASLVSRQSEIRSSLAEAFTAYGEEGSWSMLWGILGFSFVYGVLHAAGPGHRKTVVFSLYLARKAPPIEPLLTGVFLAVLHGGASIAVMSAFKGVGGAISGKTDALARYLEGGSYSLLVAASLLLLVMSLREFFSIPTEEKRSKAGRMSLGALFASGAYPCPGAILVLVLALTLDRFFLGILSVLSMSLGMSVPIILAGYLAWFGRTGLFLGLKSNTVLLGRISAGIEFLGYLLLFLFSVWMALPFLQGLYNQVLR